MQIPPESLCICFVVRQAAVCLYQLYKMLYNILLSGSAPCVYEITKDHHWILM